MIDCSFSSWRAIIHFDSAEEGGKGKGGGGRWGGGERERFNINMQIPRTCIPDTQITVPA